RRHERGQRDAPAGDEIVLGRGPRAERAHPDHGEREEISRDKRPVEDAVREHRRDAFPDGRLRPAHNSRPNAAMARNTTAVHEGTAVKTAGRAASLRRFPTLVSTSSGSTG